MIWYDDPATLTLTSHSINRWLTGSHFTTWGRYMREMRIIGKQMRLAYLLSWLAYLQMARLPSFIHVHIWGWDERRGAHYSNVEQSIHSTDKCKAYPMTGYKTWKFSLILPMRCSKVIINVTTYNDREILCIKPM